MRIASDVIGLAARTPCDIANEPAHGSAPVKLHHVVWQCPSASARPGEPSTECFADRVSRVHIYHVGKVPEARNVRTSVLPLMVRAYGDMHSGARVVMAREVLNPLFAHFGPDSRGMRV